MLRLVAFVLGILAATPCLACQSNVDCEPGSKCIKQSGKLYGYCAAGSFPGNQNDRSPDPRRDRSSGNTCTFTTDCDPGYVCAKESGRLEGACVRR